MKKMLLLLSVVLLFSYGCARVQPTSQPKPELKAIPTPQSKPTPEEIANADYGYRWVDYQETIIQFISEDLFDPYSAVFSDWKEPSKGWARGKEGFVFGYQICVAVNAKNRMGGYTGKKWYFIMMKDRSIILFERNIEHCGAGK
jgi:hypothetical protein